jgi:cell fate (sporulation/competence/biofilm development) regulator YlbF (YheA/YmcA/DUF963 family)
MTDIIIQAYRVLDELKEDPHYIKMKTLDRLIGERYPNEIQSFHQAKMIYDDVMATGGSYHPDFKQAVQAFSLAKTALYSKPEVIDYFQTEKAFELEINTFLKSMTDSISDHIQTPNKLGIVQKGGSCHVR